MILILLFFFFFQAEDGIRDLVRSRGLGDVYKRQAGHRLEQHIDPLRKLQKRMRGAQGKIRDAEDQHLSLIHI